MRAREAMRTREAMRARGAMRARPREARQSFRTHTPYQEPARATKEMQLQAQEILEVL